MHLNRACISILSQLGDLVNQIKEQDFSVTSETLSKATIGQHLRHTLEFFICFEQGFNQGVINYDKRSHDIVMENDKYIALAAINRIIDFVNTLTGDKPLKLEAGYDLKKDQFVTIQTTAMRELVYTIEHAVHHMAIMKIGVREIAPYVNLPHDFGVAASTLRHKETAVHSNHQ